jgi:putative membrane protein
MPSVTTEDRDFVIFPFKGMVKDHEEDITMFKKEAASGQDPDAKAYAAATLPTLRAHLKRIKSIATTAGVSVD